MLTRIHVNRHHIASNAKDGLSRPVFTAATSKGSRRGNGVVCHGPVTFVYRPEKPLKCGARAWVETRGEVEVLE